jgi:hypothetical protein
MNALLAALLIVSSTWTVDGVDYPQCVNEDGSGTTTPCVWIDPDTGDHYLTYPDYSIRIAR